MRPEPPVGRKLAKSWLLQNLGWSALTEAFARAVLEGGFCILLWVLGARASAIVLGWVVFHTVAWLLLYGGYSRIRVVLGLPAPMSRLHSYLDHVTHLVTDRSAFREILLRGSAAGRGLSEYSDIDILFVPERTFRSKTRGMLFMWALRLESVAHRVPLQARWVDLDGYLATQVVGESPIDLKPRAPAPSWASRLAKRGLLVAFSGIDGSGKTTVAQRIVSDLRSRGIDAAYFYGHRQAWYVKERPPQFSLTIGFEEVWTRIGRTMEDLGSFPRAKFVYDWFNCIDYLYVRWKLAGLLRPGRIVVSDRYAMDVLADLAYWGPVHESVAGFLLGIPVQPDLGVLFSISPEDALKRKQEWPLSRLRRLASEHTGLRNLFGLIAIDASRPEREVRSEIERLLGTELRVEFAAPDVELGGRAIGA